MAEIGELLAPPSLKLRRIQFAREPQREIPAKSKQTGMRLFLLRPRFVRPWSQGRREGGCSLRSRAPVGDPCNSKLLPARFARWVFVFSSALTKQVLYGFIENKNPVPQVCGTGVIWRCGERGIRTPGPADAGQRFSRPPHSTTLPSLLRIIPL